MSGGFLSSTAAPGPTTAPDTDWSRSDALDAQFLIQAGDPLSQVTPFPSLGAKKKSKSDEGHKS